LPAVEIADIQVLAGQVLQLSIEAAQVPGNAGGHAGEWDGVDNDPSFSGHVLFVSAAVAGVKLIP
jgi:hypothetical protein